MIYGIGIDLVNINRMESVLKRWGERFIERVFTEEEAGVCLGRARSASCFALRFAAKEAFSKALGLGMRRGIRWRDIEVIHSPAGKPGLRLKGRSSAICEEEGITGRHLSLSDDGEYGIGMVILEKGDEIGQGI
ncbi:MAG: holo-ACP synthase [Deltaproteobacteria bacterium]|nr:holo-ACP synthase [Deltaproteobacteria bacterium]